MICSMIVSARFTFHSIIQVEKFNSKGLSAAMVTGESKEDTKRGVEEGHYQIVLFTPETLINNRRWRNLLRSDLYAERLKGFVIDEAHCVKKW